MDLKTLSEAFARMCARLGGEVETRSRSGIGTVLLCKLRNPVKIEKVAKTMNEVVLTVGSEFDEEILSVPATSLVIRAKPTSERVYVDASEATTSIYDIVAERYIEARVSGDIVRVTIV